MPQSDPTICDTDNNRQTSDQIFLRQKSAAELLCVSGRTMERWRLEGNGPPFRRFGRRVVYARADLMDWAENQRRTSTSEHTS